MNDAKEENYISAVVYVHDAEASAGEFLKLLAESLQERFRHFEIICVNDGSADGSADIIRSFSKNRIDGAVTLLNMSYFQGLEMAMNAGVDLAAGDFVYEFDSTVASYPKNFIWEVYCRCLDGYDIVTACPADAGRRGSGLFYRIYNSVSGSQHRLRTEAFRILSRRAINRVQAMSRTLPYRKAVYANCGLKMAEMEYRNIRPIPAARSRERAVQKDTATDALVLYTDIAYRLAFRFSMLMVAVTAACTLYTVYVFFTGRPVRGWTTTMFVLSFGFFGVSCLMTMLMKYASLILRTVFTRQKYLVESIEKL